MSLVPLRDLLSADDRRRLEAAVGSASVGHCLSKVAYSSRAEVDAAACRVGARLGERIVADRCGYDRSHWPVGHARKGSGGDR